MNPYRFTIAGLMIAVALIAVDCTIALVPGLFAGGLLVGLALQVGLYLFLTGHGRRRHFWLGFEATGLSALLVYEVGIHVFYRSFIRWPQSLFGGVRGVLLQLPPDRSDLTDWLIRRAYFFDLSGNLMAIRRLALFELAYGPPMLLLAAAGGLMAVLIGSRGVSPASTTPVVIS